VDWNRDNDFSDAGELVAGRSISSRSPFLTSFTVPATAALGNTRMRISFSGDNCVNACTPTFALGEVEDYTLNITAAMMSQSIAMNKSETPILYPNPTNSDVTIRSESDIKSVSVVDITGKLMTYVSNIAQTQTTISLVGLPTGIYLFQIETITGEKSYHKVVKE
jgi:bacillolysin